ncbi:AAA family ATPase [Acidovorax delafieldii]|uniref:AAA family ATPase n=1 Tax=Acidovorax delafieldii TaxID=47920 RepID=UPI003ECC811D
MENAKKCPVVQRFTMRGVHGYKDLSVEFAGPATVIAADNGTGKTTLLNALNAFLSLRFHRLNSLSFVSLECKFSELDEPVILDRSDLGGGVSDETAEQLSVLASHAEISDDELSDFLLTQYLRDGYDKLRHTDIVSKIYINNPGDHIETRRTLDSLTQKLLPFITDRGKVIGETVRNLLKGIEIVYLPTYRRIEKPLLRTSVRRGAGRDRYGRVVAGINSNKYLYQGVAFGLGDIEARLAELSEEIERESNFGYRSLSARILNDMMKGKYLKQAELVGDLPDVETLSLFLGRLGRIENNPANLFEDIENLYKSKKIFSDEFEFLRYFLARLNSVILKTKSLEERIKHFVNVCNGYLMMSSDEKQLQFDPRNLRVSVLNSWAGKDLDLDTLSSGEKQIVSLMAKLYLYEGNKFVLVDEPELSLSLEWQRKVLPDVVRSGSVTQLLAITHSPFIFENELDQFAVPLMVTKTRGV